MIRLHLFIHGVFDNVVNKLTHQEEGQTAVEYALVLALVAIVLVLALATGLGGALTSTIAKITNKLT